MNAKEFKEIMDHENVNTIIMIEDNNIVLRNIGNGIYHMFKDDRTHISLNTRLMSIFEDRLNKYRNLTPRKRYFKD